MKIHLLSWQTAHMHSLVKYAGNPQITCFMSDGFSNLSTLDGAKKFIKFANSGTNKLYRAIEVDGQVVGGIGFSVQTDIYRKNAELGYWLAEPFHGNGIASKAILLILKEASDTFDITRIYAKPFSNNPASHRVLEKAGFKLEAVLEKTIFKNGEYLNEHIYGFRINDK